MVTLNLFFCIQYILYSEPKFRKIICIYENIKNFCTIVLTDKKEGVQTSVLTVAADRPEQMTYAQSNMSLTHVLKDPLVSTTY